MRSGAALGFVLLGAGALWLLSAAGVVDLSYTTWIGVLLIAVGLAIMLTPGRHGLLVVVGILVVLAGVPAAALGDDLLEGGIGERTDSPAAASELEPFKVGIGKLTVDLTAPGLELDAATVEASVGIGDLLVIVPEDTDVSVDAHVGVGNADVLDEMENGVDVDLSLISGTSGAQELELELEVGVGNLRVERAP
jgi:predicted membrane protein